MMFVATVPSLMAVSSKALCSRATSRPRSLICALRYPSSGATPPRPSSAPSDLTTRTPGEHEPFLERPQSVRSSRTLTIGALTLQMAPGSMVPDAGTQPGAAQARSGTAQPPTSPAPDRRHRSGETRLRPGGTSTVPARPRLAPVDARAQGDILAFRRTRTALLLRSQDVGRRRRATLALTAIAMLGMAAGLGPCMAPPKPYRARRSRPIAADSRHSAGAPSWIRRSAGEAMYHLRPCAARTHHGTSSFNRAQRPSRRRRRTRDARELAAKRFDAARQRPC